MGAMMIGVVVSAVLHGLCLLQAFRYYQSALIVQATTCSLCFRVCIGLNFAPAARLQER